MATDGYNTQPTQNGTADEGEAPGPDDKACTVCKYSDRNRKATDVCTDCDDMFLCKKCKYSHRQKPLTRHHNVIPITAKVSENLACDKHDSRPIKHYCVPCEELLCDVCVESSHQGSGHEVRKFYQFVQEVCDDMSDARKRSEMRANDLYAVDGEMKDLKEVLASRMEKLTTEIEEHANSSIRRIMKQRDDMVFRVQRTCDVRGIEQTMEEWGHVRTRITEGIKTGVQLSAQEVASAGQVADLIKAKNELKILGNYKQVSSRPYRERLNNLPSFVPVRSDVMIGRLVEAGSGTRRKEPQQQGTPHATGTDVQYKDQTGNFDLPFPLHEHYRNLHAVAHLKPEGYAALASSSDVGAASALLLWIKECFHVLSYGIHPAWDIDVDNQGVITVLCSSRPYLRMFDPETRTRCGSVDVRGDLSYPQSLAVNSSRGHYVVLDGMGNHRLVVLDRDGVVLQYLKVGWDHWRISSDEKFLASCSSQEITIFEWHSNSLGKTRSFLHDQYGFNVRDVSCHGGDLYISGVTGDNKDKICTYKLSGRNLFHTLDFQALSFKDADLTVGDNWWVRCDMSKDNLLIACRTASTNFGRLGVFQMGQTSQESNENNVQNGTT